MTLSVTQKLNAAGAIALLVILTGVLAVTEMTTLARTTARVDTADETIARLQSVLGSISDGETGQRGYLLTGDSAYLDPYHAAKRRADSVLALLRSTAAGSLRAHGLDSLQRDVDRKFAELDRSIGLYDHVTPAAALALVRTGRGRVLMDSARVLVAELTRDTRAARSAEAAARGASERRVLWAVIVGSLVALVLSVLIGRTLRADVTRQIGTERQLRAAATRSSYLAHVSGILGSSLDYEATLRQVAQLTVPELADWCIVHVLLEDGTIRQLAVAHVDPTKVERAKELAAQRPPDANADSGVPLVLRTGQPQFHPTVTEAALNAGTMDDAQRRLVRELGITSVLIVPMLARGRTLGAITMISAESGEHYTEDDLTLAQDLASRAAVAVDNARLYRDAEAARGQALAANSAKSEFLATMSHEIRTPINATLGYAQLLEMGISGPLTDTQRTQVERIRASSQHLLGLVNEVLDLAKVESGTLTVQDERARSGEAVDAALALLRPQAAAKGVTLSEQCEGDHDTSYVGDVHRVRQILTNLVANAVKFTGPGGHVSVACALPGDAPPHLSSAHGPYVALRVIDSGIGIAAGDLERIFQPFTQAEAGYTRQRMGTGLGLTISRRLALMMHGDITVESEPGKGSTFTLWLPAAREAVADAAASALAAAQPSAAEHAVADVETSSLASQLTHEAERSRETPPRPRAAAHEVSRRDALEAIAATMLASVRHLTDDWVGRLRAADLPSVHDLTTEQIEDHAATFITDIALTVRALGAAVDSGSDPSGVMRDSTRILYTIAERHGGQRWRLQWSEDEVEMEMKLMGKLLRECIRTSVPVGGEGAREAIDEAIRVVTAILDQAARTARSALRSASAE
jgi:signal transduction histidine kinase/CHASE3 domain sensor protein